MKKVIGVSLGLLLAVGTLTSPALAYQVQLLTWNVSEIQSSGDHVDVDITGNTVTFTFVGGGLTNTFQAMKDIFFQPAVFEVGNSITGVPSEYTLSCGDASGTGHCQADGFSINPAGAEYSTASGSSGPTTATFTFANTVVAGLTSSAFDVHVTYSGDCSGFVDGQLKGSPSSNSNCTPVPEPITMFLGGTGLLTLGYAARKRLFGERITNVA